MQCSLDLELPAICMVELCKGVTSYMMSNCVREHVIITKTVYVVQCSLDLELPVIDKDGEYRGLDGITVITWSLFEQCSSYMYVGNLNQ